MKVMRGFHCIVGAHCHNRIACLYVVVTPQRPGYSPNSKFNILTLAAIALDTRNHY